MPFYLSRQILWQGLVVRVPCEDSEPVVQVADLVYKPHLLFIVRYDLNKAAHDIRKECNSTKHQENCNEPFHIAYRIVVTVSYSGECRECVVAADD